MKFLRLILCVLLTFCIGFTCFYGYKLIPEKEIINSTNTKSILSLWHVDTFEGGLGSKRQFLLKVARQFEKQNPNVLVMVSSYTVESYSRAVASGNLPDMLSFGVGLNVNGLRQISVSDGLQGGVIADKRYAVGWCRGAYAFIVNKKLCANGLPKEVVVSLSDQNLTQLAYLQSGIIFEKFSFLDSDIAYNTFVAEKTPCLLGTQKDLYRLLNRGIDVNVYPITEYNDLIQYIGVLSSDMGKINESQQFIQLLCSQKVQTSLNGLGLFSGLYMVNCQDDKLNDLQKTFNCKTISALIGASGITNLKDLCSLAINGDILSANKIKKLLV